MNDESDIFPAQITATHQVTPRIKTFRLSYGNRPYKFMPGQWIDLYAPVEGKNIGGYTITSSIHDKGFIDLAVRESTTHPVTQFLHQTKVGDEVRITEGQGRFYLTEELQKESLTLIAGGIGITPLLSMFRSVDKKVVPLKVFYSVSSNEDILFESELAPFTSFTVTKNPTADWTGETTRINLAFLKKHQVDFNSHFFICGPRPMIDALTSELLDFGVPKNRIHFEKWW